MAHAIHRFPRTVTQDNAVVEEPVYTASDYRSSVAARAIWFVTGVIITLLAFRFIFALLGANPNNPIASFVYNVSHPFVAPFFNLFSYNYVYQYGVSKFETYTLIAILIYGVIGYGLARLATIGRHY